MVPRTKSSYSETSTNSKTCWDMLHHAKFSDATRCNTVHTVKKVPHSERSGRISLRTTFSFFWGGEPARCNMVPWYHEQKVHTARQVQTVKHVGTCCIMQNFPMQHGATRCTQ